MLFVPPHESKVIFGPHTKTMSISTVWVESAATGTDRVLAPGVEFVLEVVRMAVQEQYPSFTPTLYQGVLATASRPFVTLDAMWLAFEALANSKTPAINGGTYFSLPASSIGCAVIRPVGGAPARQ